MSDIESLAQLFEEFPGIGPRQAKRFVYFLLRADSGYREKLMRELADLSGGVARCTLCHRYIPRHTHTKEDRCSICTSSLRDSSLLTLVLKDADIEAIEQANVYNGLYFVLGSLIKLTESEAPERMLARLRERLGMQSGTGTAYVREFVFALPVTTDGEHTRELLEQALKDFARDKNLALTTLGRGLSTGSELEYADSATLKSAFAKRN
jgi:recombination protein RecR